MTEDASSSAGQEGAETLKPDTLDLIFELSRTAPEEQLKASDAVDSKIFQAFATGSVLIGLAVVRGVKRDDLTLAFIVLAVAAFAVLAIAAIRALWSRTFRVPMSPKQLWNDYWPDTQTVIKHAFVADIASGYEVNQGHIKSKHKAFRFVLVALLIETSAIGAALVVSAAQPSPSTPTAPTTTTSGPPPADPAPQP